MICRKWGFSWWPSGKESACNSQDPGSVPGLRRSPGEGNRNPLYSMEFLPGNSMDRGAWQAIVHGVTKHRAQPKQLSTHVCIHQVPNLWELFLLLRQIKKLFFSGKMDLTYIAKHIYTCWLICREWSLFSFHSIKTKDI